MKVAADRCSISLRSADYALLILALDGNLDLSWEGTLRHVEDLRAKLVRGNVAADSRGTASRIESDLSE